MSYQERLAAQCLACYTFFTLIIFGINATAIKINPKSCTNAMGEKGTCMFVWQCIKQDGTQLGTCVDRFLIGTCCALPKEEDNMVPGASGVSPKSSTMPPFSPTKGTSNKDKPFTSTVSTTEVPHQPIAMTSIPLTIGTGSFIVQDVPPGLVQPVASSLISQGTTLQVITPTTKRPQPTTKKSQQVTQKPPVADAAAECGLPALMPKSKVVGGTHSSFGEWPWQVSVRRSSFFGFASTHRCGGAILNANWIATAGHCVDDLLKTHIRIRVGEYDFSTTEEPAPYQERGVERKVVHPRYNFFTYEYDLALIKLDFPIVLQRHVKPICLPTKDENFVGVNATVTGWGRLSEGGSLPSKLQQVQVPIISNNKCQEMFQKAGRQESIPDIFLCAGYEQGGRDSCQGDSGGPLQAKGEDGRWFLAGIISWGIGCAEPNMPGVCTRISKFTNWILENIS